MVSAIFREYDIRGIVPSELSQDTIVKIAKAFGTILRQRNLKTISVGGDVRLHTPQIKAWFIQAINETGIDVIDIGIITTPVSYFSAYHLQIDGFAMITASHNPKEYNGFKLGIGKTTIYGNDIIEVRDLAAKGEFTQGQGSCKEESITDDYCDYVIGKFKLQKPITVVYDPANATGALFGKKILEGIGATVIAINNEVDGNFPSHHPDPTIWENMIQLSEKVKSIGSPIGIGLDGDSDRIGIIDETGELIPGDLLTLILAKDLLQRRPKAKIIYEVKSTMAMEEEIEKAGGIPIMWKVGHSLLKAKMASENALLAGELSGHIFIADDYFGFDDAIYAACRVLNIMDKTGKTITQLLEGVPRYPNTPEIRCECENDDEKFKITAKAVKYFSENYKVLAIDGVRILFSDGWGLVRASNTQPTLVTRFEGKTAARRDEIKNMVLNKIQEFGNIIIGSKH